nr:outer membrane lipoprotein chaperone LolA [Dongshaea marina]
MASSDVSHLSYAARQLQQRLASIKQFSADYQQIVYDSTGQELSRSSGKVEIERPDRFRWQAEKPGKELFVSDGSSLWISDPEVGQVTVMNLADAVTNTPFLLISSGTDKFWKNYYVTYDDPVYTVTSRDPAQLLHSFRVTFDRTNNVSRFEVEQAQGQRSVFIFKNINDNPGLKSSLFKFTPPAGADVDDQRR